MQEAALTHLRFPVAEPAIAIQRRQMRQTDAGGIGGGDHAAAQLGRIVVGPAIGLVMHVMKFGHRREAGLQHFGIELPGNRLDILGRQPRREAVHGLPPGPETVGAGRHIWSAAFGQPGHRALEGMAVQVGQAGQNRTVQPQGRCILCIRGRLRDQASGIHADQHIVVPAIRQ